MATNHVENDYRDAIRQLLATYLLQFGFPEAREGHRQGQSNLMAIVEREREREIQTRYININIYIIIYIYIDIYMMNLYACMYYSTDYHCITMMFFSYLLVPTMVHGSQEGC